MPPLYVLISGAIGLVTAMAIIYLIRRDHLHIRYALNWIIIAIAIALFGINPQIIDYLSDQLGISYPPILAVVMAVCFMLLKLLLNDIQLSRQERQLIRLTQRLGMLEADRDTQVLPAGRKKN